MNSNAVAKNNNHQSSSFSSGNVSGNLEIEEIASVPKFGRSNRSSESYLDSLEASNRIRYGETIDLEKYSMQPENELDSELLLDRNETRQFLGELFNE